MPRNISTVDGKSNSLNQIDGREATGNLSMIEIPWLDQQLWFPAVNRALLEPNGLLAVGGDLQPERLLLAYRSGIFPWFDELPILWWSPNPRSVLHPAQLHISRSLAKLIRRQKFKVSINYAFEQVISACAGPRQDADGTWITEEMHHAYRRLHQMGWAHSVEAWQQDRLVGGLYGIAMGKLFFGESMFSKANNASKIAFYHLVRYLLDHQFAMIDCQVASAHLNRLGATLISRDQFINTINQYADATMPSTLWQAQILCDGAK